VGQETPSLITGDVRLLPYQEHRALLQRLQRANLIIPVQLSLNLEGSALINQLRGQILEHTDRERFQFPAPSQPFAEFGTLELTIHDLPFVICELTMNHKGGHARFRKTQLAEPLTLQVLLSTRFSKRIPNPLRLDKKVPIFCIGEFSNLFFSIPPTNAMVAPANGLLRMPVPVDADLCRVIGFNHRSVVPPGIRPPLHACLGPLIMNGYTNPSIPAMDADILCCLEGCDDYDEQNASISISLEGSDSHTNVINIVNTGH